MIGLALRFVGSLALLGWGIALMIPLRSVLRGFGAISAGNRRVVVSTWIGDGLALAFVGALMGLVTYYGGVGYGLTTVIGWASAGFLLALALVGWMTKARVPSLLTRTCPWIETTVAILFILSNIL